MKRVVVQLTVTAPDDATHYSGDIIENVTWWKFASNTTGTCKAWFCKRHLGDPWWLHNEGEESKPPDWVYPIKEINHAV